MKPIELFEKLSSLHVSGKKLCSIPPSFNQAPRHFILTLNERLLTLNFVYVEENPKQRAIKFLLSVLLAREAILNFQGLIIS